MEEVPGAVQQGQLWRLRQSLDPFQDLCCGNHVVSSALNKQPRDARGRQRIGRQIPDGRGRGYQPVRSKPLRPSEHNGGTERKAGQPERTPGPAFSGPADHGTQILKLPISVPIRAFACSDTAKIEPNTHRSELAEAARQLMHHLVLHGATTLGMRMANDGNRPDAVRGLLFDKLEDPGRTGDRVFGTSYHAG